MVNVDGSEVEDEAGWLVDPYGITDFRRTPAQMEAFFLFCPAVAGKKATVIAGKLQEFLLGCGHPGWPFARIRAMVREESLVDNLRRVRMGKYSLLEACYCMAAEDTTLDLRTATPARLEEFPGYGMKSSRFLVLHSRPGARVAVVDTHLLKYLRHMGVPDVPATIPTGRDYLRMEQALLEEADRLGMDPADFDLRVWSWYSLGARDAPDLVVGSGAILVQDQP